MAEQPSDSFVSDYIKRQRDVYRQQIMGAPSGGISDPTPLRRPEPEVGVLGGIIDFLSRPLYAVTNIANKALDVPEQFRQADILSAQGKTGEALQKRFGALGDVAVAPITGLFATDRENKNYTSDLMEKAADVAGKNNPNYVDVENNIPAAVKGVVGFAGDVALDPLMYIPGAQIAKGLGTVMRGAQKAASLIPKGAGATKAADEVAETVLGAERSTTKKPTNMGDVAESVTAPAQAGLKLSERIAQGVKKGELPNNIGSTALRSLVNDYKIFKGAKPLSRRNQIDSFLKSWSAGKFINDVPEASARFEFDDWVGQMDSLSDEALAKISIPKQIGTVKLKDGNLLELQEKVSKLSPAEQEAFAAANRDVFREQVLRPLYDEFTRGFDSGAPVDLLGRTRIEPTNQLDAAENIVQRLAQLSGTELANAEQVFTRPLLNSLQRLNAEEMAAFVDNAQAVLRSKGLVEGMGNVTGRSAERNLLRAFDIDLATFRAARADLTERVDQLLATGPARPLNEAIDNLANDTGFIAELTTRLDNIGLRGEGIVEDSAKVIQDALRKTFKENFDVDDLVARGYKPYVSKNGTIYVTDKDFGAGIARILNSYNSGAQGTFYTELSKGFALLFKGVPVVDDAGKIVSKFVGGRRVYEYEKLPAYVKGGAGDEAYRAYKGYDLAGISERATIAALKSAEDFVTSKGVAIVMDATPKGGKRVVETLRFSDAYELTRIGFKNLAANGQINREVAGRMLQLLLFNANTGMSRAHFMDASLALLSGASKPELLAILRRDKTRYGKKLDKGANWLAGKPKEAKFGFYPTTTPFPKDVPGLKPEALYREIRGKKELVGYYAVWNSADAAEYLADAMIASRNGFLNVAQIRKQQYLARGIEEFGFVTPQIAQNLVRLFSDKQAAGNALRAVDNLGSIVIDYMKAIDATDLAAVYAAGAIRNVIPSTVHNASKFANDFVEAVARGDQMYLDKLRKRASDATVEDLNKINKEGVRAADEVGANPTAHDEYTQQQAQRVKEVAADTPEPRHNGFAQIMMGLSKILSPLNAKWGMDVRNHLSAWLEFQSLGVAPTTYLSKLKTLDNLRKKYPNTADGASPVLTEAMRELQAALRTSLRSEKPVKQIIAEQANPTLRQAMTDLYDEVGQLFNVSGDLVTKLIGAMNSPFGRMGLTPEQLNTFFARNAVLGRNADGMAKMPESGSLIDFNKVAQDAADLYDGDRLTAMLNQWVDWNIENPLEFLTSTHSALYKMLSETQFVDNFGAYALREGLGADNAADAARLGFVKLDPASNTHFGHLIPENLYVDESMAYIFNRMDEAMRPSPYLNTEFGKAINKYFDVILDRWKTTVTILRPGHHIRNMVGSMSLRFFALGTKYFLPSDTLSGRILSRRNTYKGVNMVDASNRTLGGRVTESIPTDSEIVIRTKLGNMTARELEDDFYKYLAIEGKRAEDLFEDQILKTRFSETVDKFFKYVTLGAGKRGGPVEEFALDVSWYVQHRNILAHYIQALQQAAEATAKKPFVRGLTDTAVPKNFAEARALALESALKYHPTPNMLTAWEKAFPRRLFPFYTWIKLASVALAQASILNPARTLTTIPKASYNLAIAMGLDPYSMYHPFPTDQLFPSFLTDEMTGPQFEIDGKYVAVSPGFASLDLYNTFADPVEGTTQLLNPMIRIPIELLAGSRLGTQAPITDISDFIDSSIPGINYVSNITGRSVTGLGAPQSQVERGNKTLFDQSLSAWNWLTGTGVRNYSRPNYINFAEIEMRNRAAEEGKVEENLINFLLGRLE